MSFCACAGPRQITSAGLCGRCDLRVQVKGSGWAPCLPTAQEKTATQLVASTMAEEGDA